VTEHATVEGIDGITPGWLTAVLGAHTGGASVVSATTERVGTGQVADTVRLGLEWDPPGAGPETLVAKVTAADETSRATAAMTRTYEIEAAFYNELAPTLPVRAPRCYHAAHDPEAGTYAVVLEDLAPARQGDQIAGCSLDEAGAAVLELVQLHAPRWADPRLADLPWLDRHDDDGVAGSTALLHTLADGFLARYEATLDPEVAELVPRLMERVEGHLLDRPRPWTVTHGDYRLDNLLFGGERVAVVDWQTVGHGPGLADLSYFVGASLHVEDRRAHERDLVQAYSEAMRSAGVDGLDPDTCWAGYRRHTFSGLIMAVAASMLVGQTDRGDEMFMAMANRHGRHALDLDALSMIPS
jgi:hypothetical protein